MFTGLIEAVGARRAASTPCRPGSALRIRDAARRGAALGESVAVNGVCLTVTVVDGGEVQADIGPETARVTTLGALRPDQPVNLERSMRADSRFGGHFVQGHVDATGTVEDVRAGRRRALADDRVSGGAGAVLRPKGRSPSTASA